VTAKAGEATDSNAVDTKTSFRVMRIPDLSGSK